MKRCAKQLATLWLWTLSVGAQFAQPVAGPQFEVAAIRRSAGMETMDRQIQQGALHLGISVKGASVTIGMMSVYDMVAAAYRVKPDQVANPGWMNTDHWDIDAKISDASAKAAVPEMLASLLRDRFTCACTARRASKRCMRWWLAKTVRS